MLISWIIQGLITRALRRERGRQKRELEIASWEWLSATLLALWMEEGAERVEKGAASRSGKGKKADYLPQPLQKVCSPADTLVLAQSDLVWTSDLWDSRITKQCCLSLSVCGHLFQQQWWLIQGYWCCCCCCIRCSCVWLCAISDYFVCVSPR